jgi:hypothetical protein
MSAGYKVSATKIYGAEPVVDGVCEYLPNGISLGWSGDHLVLCPVDLPDNSLLKKIGINLFSRQFARLNAA